ncbi:MAG: DUF916 and DUF3324 domain-containing protein [Oscillospiraceae bacterium]|nr:DUF916 and DUF3324 domain-containing protein [Oscillospiraceae bacterium]
MHKAIKSLATIIAIALLYALAAPLTLAASDSFSVAPVLPENQSPESLGSFNLDVMAGQTQEIEVLVSNPSSDFITVEVSLLTPGTSRSGVIDFSQSGTLDETLDTSFADIAELKVESTITIPSGATAVVPIALHIPSDGFEGVVFGAIHVLLTVSEEEMAQAGQFVNRFAQVIPVRLFVDRANTIISDFQLGDIELSLVAGVAALEANIRNPQPRFCIGAMVGAEIYPKGTSTPIFTVADLEVDFAPNSVYPLTMLDNAGYGILTGDYVANISVEFGGSVWIFEQDFHISRNTSNEVNSNAINQQAPPNLLRQESSLSSLILWIVVGSAGFVLVLCTAIMVVVRVNKNR